MRRAAVLIGAVMLTVSCLSWSAAETKQQQAFKTSYDQLLEELPNVKGQLVEKNDGSSKVWRGLVELGTASVEVTIDGRDKDALAGIRVDLKSTPQTSNFDYDRAETLRDVLIRRLIGSGEAYRIVQRFFVDELKRQEPIIMAGGKPNVGRKTFANGNAEARTGLTLTPSGLEAMYSFRLTK